MYNIDIGRTLLFSQLVELKNGETYNGHLVSCDNWMNINLREVICTSRVSFFSSAQQLQLLPLCAFKLCVSLQIFAEIPLHTFEKQS